jgi:hypothetical protein
MKCQVYNVNTALTHLGLPSLQACSECAGYIKIVHGNSCTGISQNSYSTCSFIALCNAVIPKYVRITSLPVRLVDQNRMVTIALHMGVNPLGGIIGYGYSMNSANLECSNQILTYKYVALDLTKLISLHF